MSVEGDETLLSSLDNLLTVAYFLRTLVNSRRFQQNQSQSFDWNKLDSFADEISKLSTTLALIFDRKMPDAGGQIQSVDKLQFVTAAFAQFLSENIDAVRRNAGKLAANELEEFLSELSDALIKFIESLKSARNYGKLRQTGVIWEKCDRVRSLSRDPISSTLKIMAEQKLLISDATKELRENLLSDPENDAKIVAAILALLKCSTAILSKLTSTFEENAPTSSSSISIENYNLIAEKCQQMSGCVDDMAAEFYSAQESREWRRVGEEATQFRVLQFQILTAFEQSAHFNKEKDAKRVEFLRKAVEHNTLKLENAIK